jgi:CzcA family heavy metal efflux pump
MRLTEWIHSHHRSVLFLLAVLAAGGVASALGLPVALFPQVAFPRVAVDLDAGDRPGERMAMEVTWPVEEAVRSVPGVRNIRSITSRGASEISINFDWNTDMPSAMLQVDAAVARVMPELPAGTRFDVRLMDPTVFPVLGYSLTSEKRSLTELRDIAQYQVRPVLSTVSGVAKTDVQGGQVEEYRIEVYPARLASYGLTAEDVSKVLAAANVLSAVGRLEDHSKLYLIISNTSPKDPEEIGRTVLKTDAGGLVRLSDVADVRRDAQPQWTRVTADGRDAVLIDVFQQPGGNTVQIASDIKAKLTELEGRLPPDVKVANWYDQSELIVSSAESVRDAVLVGVALSVLILLVFLRNAKITLIAAMVVPAVLAVTILMLYVLHMSFNIMTLGGMAAAVGLIIDDAIVMIEHIIRRLRGGTGDALARIHTAAYEFQGPLTGSSASTIIIFAPLAFLTGVTGAFFKALSLTMAASLIISYLISWLAIPLLATRLLGEKDAHRKEEGFITRPIHHVYARVMSIVLRHPWSVAIGIAPLLLAGWVAYSNVGSGFMPKMDEGGFVLDYTAPPGTSLTETDRMLRQIEGILKETPEVETYSRRTGLQLGGMVTEANEGDFFIRLKPYPRHHIEEVMAEVREKIQESVPGLEIELVLLMEDLIGDLTAVPQPIEIKLYCDDGKVLTELAPKVAEALKHIDGVPGDEVKDGLVIAGDAIEITVDREKAALEGVDPETVTGMVTAHLEGLVATQVPRGPKMVGLRVWTPKSDRATDLALPEIPLKAADGHILPLSRVATLVHVTGQPQIMRDDLRRMVAVTGRIEGRDMGSTVADVKEMLAKPGLIPPGVSYALGGLYEQQQIAFRGLVGVLAAAVALVFLLLLFLYEKFRVALAMLITTLIAAPAVFVGLWITGTELNITSIMGLTMVVGIVTEVGIFYFSEYRELKDMPYSPDRFVQAGLNRMRPIAMTTIAAIMALGPLALGWGQGAAMQQPLAIAIISGLVVQLPLALVVLPAILSLLMPKRSEPAGDASQVM